MKKFTKSCNEEQYISEIKITADICAYKMLFIKGYFFKKRPKKSLKITKKVTCNFPH